jgi:hypothetical protein
MTVGSESGKILFAFEDSYEHTLRIERIESSSFLIRSNVLLSKGLSKGLNKEFPEMTLSNVYEALSLSHKSIKLLSIILSQRSKQADML